MNRKLLTYGPVVLLALLCAAAFATGVLTRYPVLEAQVQAMDFPNGTAVSLENGDVYGVVPSGGPGHSLSAGTYRLKWFVDGDGDNALHLYSENGVKMEPETVILPAGQFEGEFEFTLDSAISGLQLQFEFAAGTYMEIYDVRIYTPGCSDNAFTLLFASLAFSLIWVAVRRGRLRTAQIEGMLMIGLAVLFASAPAFQETLHIGDDIQYHLCRIENIVDAWQCGQFLARLGAYMYDGYGALTSVFYPDYALYPFALMRLCGASLAYVGNMLLISLNIGAAAGMYAAAKRMFGGGRAAAAASTLYVLAAYRLTDVYARFAVGEALAMVFLPLFIAALWDCVAGDKNRWKALALSAAAIFLSHMITTLLCALMALLLCLMNARRILREKRLANLLKAAGLCLLLVLFHLAPMLMYIREGLGASDLMRDVSYSSIRPAELLSSNGRFAVQIGLPLMLGAALAAEAVCKRGKIGEKERAALTLVLGGAAAALAATSFFPWSYAVVLTGGLVNYIQFPWRLLALTAALLALAAAYPIAGMQGEHQKLAVVLALALSVAAVQPQLQAYVEEDGMACGVGISPHLTNVEYLIPDSYPTRTGNREYAASEGVSVTNETKRGSTVTADVDAKQDGTLLLPLFGYDGYRAQVDGQNVEVALNQAQNNRLDIHLSAGTRGTLRVRFAGKTWWRLTDAVSLLTLIGLFMERRKERKKHV